MTMTTVEERRRTGPVRAILLVLLGAAVGAVAMREFREPMPTFPSSLFAQDSSARSIGGEDGEFTYFTFRRNLWVIHRPTGQIQFFMFPDGSEQVLVRSGIYQVDLTEFPVEQTQYQLSERNLTNFLWILNPYTGKARYIRAQRDGTFDVSEVETVARRE